MANAAGLHEPPELALLAEPSSPARARRFVADALDHRCPAEVVEIAVLLVSELATNVVLHARTPMRISVLSARAGVRIEVADDSVAQPVIRIQRSGAPSGRGLVLVDRLARAWGVEAERPGKVVWFELDGVPGAGADGVAWGDVAVYSVG
jgi:anti-sigma regulatory factor (Ser/Thr protein kinase)